MGAGGGTIVNNSSIAAGGSLKGISAYNVSKSAVNRITELVELEHGDEGFRCFCYHPGGIRTAVSVRENSPVEISRGLVDNPALSAMAALSAMTAVYLASERSDYLRGRYISANWDMQELESRKEEILGRDLLKVRILIE